MNENLQNLADKLGISTSFCDAGLKRKSYEVDAKTVKFFAKALGYNADTDKQIENSLLEIENERWRHPLEPIYIRNLNNIIIDIVSSDLSNINVEAKDCNGNIINLDYQYMQNAKQKGLLYKEDIKIITPLNIGYYDLTITVGGKKYNTVLAVAPDKCYDFDNKDTKLWGYAIQLYSLKSKRNWGVGDFTDLKNFVKLCSQSGANIIGLNPLNTLSHDYPENASPYLSISRQFLNPIYIDIEQVPEFVDED